MPSASIAGSKWEMSSVTYGNLALITVELTSVRNVMILKTEISEK
jgi:hypothetical protein